MLDAPPARDLSPSDRPRLGWARRGLAAGLHLHRWLVAPPPGLDPKFADFYPLSNYVHGMGLLAHVVFLLAFWVLDQPLLAVVNVLSIAVFVGTFGLSRRGRLDPALLIGGLEVAAHQGLAVWLLGLDAGFQNYVLVLVIGTLFYSHIPLGLRVLMAVAPVGWYLVLLVWGLHTAPVQALSVSALSVLAMVNGVMFISILMGMALYFQISVASARDRAERMAASKTLFLANMSHELRTPLNAILGFAQILGRSTDVAPAHQARLLGINRSGQHLLALINRILDMSKLESGHLALQIAPFSLDHLLEDVRDMFSLAAQRQGLVLTVVRADTVPTHLLGDALRLRQVLINLVGNALKFTAVGRVQVEVLRAPRQPAQGGGALCLHFNVRDTGHGISPAEQADLFQVFTQTATGRDSRQGTGLGLALSRRIVEGMGGTIGVRSKPGRGSRFWFQVLLAADPAGVAAPVALSAAPVGLPRVAAAEPWDAAVGSLRCWPPARLEQLHQAVQRADFEGSEQCLAATSDGPVHPWLNQLLHGYRFDQLEALADQAMQLQANDTAPAAER